MKTSSERAMRAAELLKSVLEHDANEWSSFLDEACGSDAELRAEVESLLRFQQPARRFMQQPAVHLAADVFLDRELKPEETIGDYKIVSLIGSGGMGDVYLAEDRQLRRQVALKIVRRGMNTDDIVRRFQREEQILASLNHPNIARLYGGAITSDDVPFFVMEYVEGARLDDYCRENKLPLNERLTLFRKVCSAVAYAHQHLVIHRDIKPSNIRVTREGEPKLLDFGIAKLLDPATSPTVEQTMTFPGAMTLEYASPEQVRGETMATTSDVYSLGVVLYKLLTGQSPYRIKTNRPDEIAQAISEQEPTAPSTTLARSEDPNPKTQSPKLLRGDLDNIVLRALRKEPQRRYESVAQFSEDIRRYLAGLPVVARKDTWSYRSGKFIRRNKIAVAAAALIALTLLGAIGGVAWQARIATTQAQVASQQRDVAQREKLKTERINQFLHRMLSFSNQSFTSVSPVAQKKDVTVNTMLDQITPQVETELADQPEVRAQILRTIGSAYASQGQYDRAEKNLRSALETQIQLYGEENPEVAATRAELAALSLRQGKISEANQLLEKVLAFYRKQQQTNSPGFNAAMLARSLEGLGVTKLYQGDPKAAISLLNEALQTASGANLQGNEREVLALIKTDLGGTLVLTNEVEKGEPFLRDSLAEFRQISSQPRWELGVALTMLGVCVLHKKQPDEAEKFLLEGEKIYRQTLGDKNPYLSFNLEGQAGAWFQKNDLDTAVKKTHEALAMTQEIAPNNRLLWTGALKTLGDLQIMAGRAGEGETYLRQALAILEQQVPPNFLSIGQIKISLSQSLFAQNRLAEAEKIAREAYDGTKQSLGEKSPMLKPAASNLIGIYEKEGKHEAAEKLK
jgi:serine/threonine protein kinase